MKFLKRYSFVVLGLVTVFLALGMTRLHISNDISVMLPMHDEVVSDYFEVAQHFHTLESLYIDIDATAIEGDAFDALRSVADALNDSMIQSGLFDRIHHQMDEKSLMQFVDTAQRVQPALLSEADLSIIEQRLTPESIQHYLRRAKRTITTSISPIEQMRVRSDPFNFMELTIDGFDSLGNQAQGAHLVEGYILNEDENHLFMFAVPNFPPSNMEKCEALIAYLNTLSSELMAAQGDIVIRFSGGHFAHRDNAYIIKQDIQRTMPVMVLSILILSMVFFRRRFAVILILLPVAIGMTIGFGLFALFSSSIPGLVMGCAALLVGISVDYSIHVIYALDEDESDGQDGSVAMKFPTMVGAVTTIAAFLSLVVSNIEGQRLMGVLAALGIASTAWITLYMLPKLIPYMPKGKHKIELSGKINTLQQGVYRHWVKVAIFVLCIGLFACVGLRTLSFEGDFEKLNYLQADHRADDDIVRRIWQNYVPSSVVLQGDTLQQALEDNDRLFLLMNDLQEEGMIHKVSSLAPFLPSLSQQEERWQRWNDFWVDERVEQLRVSLSIEADALGFAPSAFEALFVRLKEQPSYLHLSEYQGNALASLLESKISEVDGITRIQTTFVAPDLETYEAIQHRVKTAFPEAVVMNGPWFRQHTRALVSNEMKRSALIASVVIIICLLISLGSIELVVVVLSPVLMGIVITLGLLGWFNVPVNLVSSLFIVFVLGVGVDFNIFLMSARLDEYRNQSTSQSVVGSGVVLCASTTLFGFLSLMYAQHPAIHSIGVTGFIGIASCLVMSFLMTPLLMNFLLPKNGQFGVGTWSIIARSTWTLIILPPLLCFYVLVLKPIWHLQHKGDLLTRQRMARRYIRWLFSSHIDHFPYAHNPRRYINAQPEVFEKPAILISNHQSLLDVLLVISLPCDMVMVVKEGQIGIPIYGILLKDAGYICPAYQDLDAFVELCRKQLENNVSVMMFPEGTRSHDGVLRRFRKGAFEVALQTGTDIIPIVLSNTRSGICGTSFSIGHYSVIVRVLDRIKVTMSPLSPSSKSLANEVKALIASHTHEDYHAAQQDATFWQRLPRHYVYQGTRVRMNVRRQIRRDMLLRAIDSLVPMDARVLVVGCNIGLLAHVLALYSTQRIVMGIDTDAVAIAVAQSASRQCINAHFASDPLTARKATPWQVIVFVDQWNHDDDNISLAKLQEAVQCLDDSGTILFRDSGDPNHYRNLVEQAGLQITQEHNHLAQAHEVVWTLEKSDT